MGGREHQEHRALNFVLTGEQVRYRDEVRRFAERELNHDVDGREGLCREAWARCAELGIQGLPVPRRYGGREADPLTTVAALEALGHGCRDGGLLFSLGAHTWSCEVPILLFGSEPQRRRYLPGLCGGSLIIAQFVRGKIAA